LIRTPSNNLDLKVCKSILLVWPNITPEHLYKQLTNGEPNAEKRIYYTLYTYREEEQENFSGPVCRIGHQTLYQELGNWSANTNRTSVIVRVPRDKFPRQERPASVATSNSLASLQQMRQARRVAANTPTTRINNFIAGNADLVRTKSAHKRAEWFTNRSNRTYERTTSSSIEDDPWKDTNGESLLPSRNSRNHPESPAREVQRRKELLNRHSTIIDGTIFEVLDGKEMYSSVRRNHYRRSNQEINIYRDGGGDGFRRLLNPSKAHPRRDNDNHDKSSEDDNHGSSSENDRQDNEAINFLTDASIMEPTRGNSSNLIQHSSYDRHNLLAPGIGGQEGRRPKLKHKRTFYDILAGNKSFKEGKPVTMITGARAHSAVRHSNISHGSRFFRTIGKRMRRRFHGQQGQYETLIERLDDSEIVRFSLESEPIEVTSFNDGMNEVDFEEVVSHKNWLYRMLKINATTRTQLEPYGLRILEDNRHQLILRAFLMPTNLLGLKEMTISVDIRVYYDGRNYGQVVVRFARERGAATLLNRRMEITEQYFEEKYLLVINKGACRQMKLRTFS
ncbi:hypothetical protein RUND412_007978, partial [Rhizina undulata]